MVKTRNEKAPAEKATGSGKKKRKKNSAVTVVFARHNDH